MAFAFNKSRDNIEHHHQCMAVESCNRENIPILKIGGDRNLLFNRSLQRKHLIPKTSCLFKLLGPGGGVHLLFDFGDQILGATVKKHDCLIDLFPIDFGVDIQTAWRQTAFHLTVQARSRARFKILGAAFSQFESFVDGLKRLADSMSRSKRAEIICIVLADFAYNGKTGIFLLQVQPQRGVAFVIF